MSDNTPEHPSRLTARALVSTTAGPRYLKQLASHLGHKLAVEHLADGSARFTVGTDSGVVRPVAVGLELEATGSDEVGLARVTDVLGRHLERFGERDGLTVAWTREP